MHCRKIIETNRPHCTQGNISRMHYDIMLDTGMTSFFNDKNAECENDMKAVTDIMNDVLYGNKKVKLPTYSSAKLLADEFANFFKGKIDKIRNGLSVIYIRFGFPMPLCMSSWNQYDTVSDTKIHVINAKSRRDSAVS